MILVFILCTIIILVISIIHINILSTFRISIKNLEISNIPNEKQKNMKEEDKIDKMKPKKIENTNQIVFSLWLFNKIKWFQFKLNNKRMRKIYTKMQLEKYDFKKLEQEISLKNLKEILKLEPKVSLLNLKIKIGTEDAILTSFIVFFISTVISVILPHVIEKYRKDKYKYEILPVYINQNIYELKLNCIIEIKMVHIINMIDSLIKKRRVEKNGQSSNRRSYGYSHE